MQYDIAAINHLMRNRRTIKPENMNGQLIEDAIIQEILENANWAPTHGYTEPWRFVVYTGAARKALGQELGKIYTAEIPTEKFVQKKHDKLVNRPNLASHIIAIGMKRHADTKIPEEEEYAAVSCAVQNMYLSATAYGVAPYWGTGTLKFREAMKKLLGWSEIDRYMGMLFLGLTEAEHPKGRRISGIDTKTKWIK